LSKSKKYRASQVDKLIKKSYQSNVAQSSRRIVFNELLQSTQERGFWHSDIWSGMGSGVLIKFKNKIFLMTAQHVLKDYIKEGKGIFPNESPFWTWVNSKAKSESLYDHLMPKKIWLIGELIDREDIINTSDILLIELYNPHMFHMPDKFINIENNTFISKKEDFYEGRILQISGFPFEKNSFDWDIEHPDPNITHSTRIQRHHITGVFIDDKELGYISFEITDADVQHENVNGMSGGVVYDIQDKANQTKFCGIVVTISNNICRFIPSYILYDAVINYQNSTSIIVDPEESKMQDPEKVIEHMKSYLKKFSS